MTSMLFQFHQGLLSNLSCYKFCISVAGTIRDDLDTERQLEELAMDFRLQWITQAHSLIAGVMKSPPPAITFPCYLSASLPTFCTNVYSG